jgi:hypothetical protein
LICGVRTDVGILFIPVPLIWKVKMPLSRKLVIAALFSSGLFVITAALLRCILTLQNVKNPQAGISERLSSRFSLFRPLLSSLCSTKADGWEAQGTKGEEVQTTPKDAEDSVDLGGRMHQSNCLVRETIQWHPSMMMMI